MDNLVKFMYLSEVNNKDRLIYEMYMNFLKPIRNSKRMTIFRSDIIAYDPVTKKFGKVIYNTALNELKSDLKNDVLFNYIDNNDKMASVVKLASYCRYGLKSIDYSEEKRNIILNVCKDENKLRKLIEKHVVDYQL